MSGKRGWRLTLLATGAALACALLSPALASATQRYARPGGLTTGNCTDPDQSNVTNGPCDLIYAVQTSTGADTLDLLPGNYSPAFAVDPGNGKSGLVIQGAPGHAIPVIVSNVFNTALTARPGVTLRRLAVVYGGGASAVLSFGGTIEQVFAHTTTGLTSACTIDADAVLRDSVCWASSGAVSSSGVLVEEITSGTVSATLRNVTAIATGAGFGIRARAVNVGTHVTVDALNTIARGGFDVHTETGDATTSAEVTLANSNYATEDEQGSGSSVSVTDPGTGTNQTAAPLFADSANGDFHQLACAPSISSTVDGGIAGASVGSADIDGDPRQVGSAVDIGADEATPNCPVEPEPEPGDTAAPDTQITAGPEGKTKQKSASFGFSGTDTRAVASFQCKLDDGQFETCSSPQRYSRLKKGSHTFEVRAVDAAGNTDPSPATRTWKIKNKKKK